MSQMTNPSQAEKHDSLSQTVRDLVTAMPIVVFATALSKCPRSGDWYRTLLPSKAR